MGLITLDTVGAGGPNNGDTGVSQSAKQNLNIDDDTHNLILSTAVLSCTRGLTLETVYSGGSYQGAWSGDAPTGDGTQQIQFRNIQRSGGYFEDHDSLDTTFAYEIETVGYVRNSGFEVPGTTAAQAKHWTAEGTIGVEGTDFGRIDPLNTTAPEGQYVHGQGINNFVGGAEFVDPQYFRVYTTSLDLTDATFIRLSDEKLEVDTVDADETLTLYLYVGGELVWSRIIDDDDDNIDEDWASRQVTLPHAFTGVQEIALVSYLQIGDNSLWVPELADNELFDNDAYDVERFESWTDRFESAWDPGTDVPETFDGDTLEVESFESWTDRFESDWVAGSADQETFDNDANALETFESWTVE